MHVKSVPCERISATCVIFKPLSERRKSPKYSCPVLILHKYGSGVDVMITIFCDFYQFSAKKLAFFLKTNVTITIFAKTSFVLSQNAIIFAKFFGENIFKIITSVPVPNGIKR
jgi:hypothetical protein